MRLKKIARALFIIIVLVLLMPCGLFGYAFFGGSAQFGAPANGPSLNIMPSQPTRGEPPFGAGYDINPAMKIGCNYAFVYTAGVYAEFANCASVP